MSLFGDLIGAISGAGSIAEAISGVVNVAKQALGMAQAKEQRNEGAVAQREASDATTLEVLKDVSAPVSDVERDQLWDRNKAKFGPAQSTGQAGSVRGPAGP